MNVIPRSTQAAEGLPRRRFTVAEVEAMAAAGILDEDERVELIGGELIPMSPKGVRHELVKIALTRRWASASTDVFVAQETTFRLSDDTYLEPDFVLYARETGLAGIKGANVLLVVEVADSSLTYDKGRKANLYARFGVRELWVIDALRMTTHVFRRPTDEGHQDDFEAPGSQVLTPAFAPNVFALKLDELELV